jgi:putative ABC transport system permease protein
LSSYFFLINLYDLGYLGTIFVGLALAILLWFTNKINQAANRFLSLAMLTVVLQMVWVLCIDIRLGTYLPHWTWLPLQYSLALGPLIFFYVLKVTRQKYQFGWKDLIHLFPALLEQGAFALELKESIRSNTATYNTLTFQHLNPIVRLLFFISVATYLCLSRKLIQNYYRNLKFNGGDRSLQELKWLNRFLKGIFLLWLCWIVYLALDFHYHNQLDPHSNYPFYLLLAIILIRMVVVVILRSDVEEASAMPLHRQMLPAEIKRKGLWLKQKVKANMYYQDTELSLSSLAERLDLHPHELSRIINTVLKKNFNDFINEYRVQEVIQKMQERAYSHLTLLGIAFTAGFNSKSTFNRVFREMTGKSPAEYMSNLKKERPSYHLRPYSKTAAVILSHDSTVGWSRGKSNHNFMFRSYLKKTNMVQNYLKIAWRVFMRNKAYSFINVMGLALGICACVVIFLITNYDLTFDKFHPDGDRIYRITGEFKGPDGKTEFLNSPVAEVAGFQYLIPGFDKKAALHFFASKVTVKNADNKISIFGTGDGAVVTEQQYFDIFKYQWLAGDQNRALSEPYKVVLTESEARKYFGNLAPGEIIGKTIAYDSLQVSVSGIVKDWDQKTDFPYTDFVSVKNIQHTFLRNRITSDDWKSLSPHQSMAFVKLKKAVTANQINAQFATFINKNVKLPPGTTLIMRLQPLSDIHFTKDFHRGDDGDNFRKAYLPTQYALMGIALFILIIAFVNFINLSTAQSIKRTKEIGIRKVMGSSRKGLIGQFLSETFLLVVFAVITAVLFVKPVLYLFSSFIPEGVKFKPDISTIIFLGLVVLVTVITCGLYPAKMLSGYSPVVSLKGSAALVKGKVQWNLRKVLIVFQFSISLVFIISALVIENQISFMNHADKGFKTDAIITMNNWEDRTGKLKVLAQKIRQMPGVQGVILQGNAPMGFAQNDDNYSYKGKKEINLKVLLGMGNDDYIPFYSMKIVAGRNLLHSDSLKEVVINQACCKALGFASPNDALGKLLYNSDHKSFPIVGVVADFHTGSFREAIQPFVIENVPGMQRSMAVKLSAEGGQLINAQQVVSRTEIEWKKLFPEKPFSYSFLDDSIKLLNEQEQNTALLINAAMITAIFISCMGLFGLSMFASQLKTKEIGIRKVLGASVTDIVAMLSQEFISLIFIAFLIAAPIAWYFMNQWLLDFVYRISISWWIFVSAGLLAAFIALATISFHSIKAALGNLVMSLRHD